MDANKSYDITERYKKAVEAQKLRGHRCQEDMVIAESLDDVPDLTAAVTALFDKLVRLHGIVELAKALDERWAGLYTNRPHPDGVQDIRLEFWRQAESIDPTQATPPPVAYWVNKNK